MPDIHIGLNAGFDEKQALEELNKLIESLQKNADNKIKLNFDISSITNQLSSMQNQANKTGETVGKAFTEGINKGIDNKKTVMTINNTFKNVEELRNSVRQLYSSMGETSVSTSGVNSIDGFTVKVKNLDSTIEKFKYKLNESGNYELFNKNITDNQIKDLQKLEKQLLKIEKQYHNLKFEPNTKQGDINSLKSNISNFKNGNTPISTNDILNATEQVEKLGRAYENVNKKDLAEANRRVNFYDTYIAKQKELNNLTLKQLNKGTTDGSKEAMQTRINELNKELITMKNNPNNYYKKTVSVDDNYKDIIQQFNTQLKIKQTTLEDSELLKIKSSLYSELNSLQKEEYSIKSKIIGKSSEEKEVLLENLRIVKEQQGEVGKSLNNFGVKDTDKNNDLLIKKKKLTNDLIASQEKYNLKVSEEQKKVANTISNFQSQMGVKIQNLNTKYKELVPQEAIAKLNILMNDLPNQGIKNSKNLQTEIKKIKNEFNKIEADTKEKGMQTGQKDSMGFSSMVKNQFLKFSTFLGVGSIIMGLVRQVKQAVGTIVELDTVMVDLKKVTDETNATYERFLGTAHNIGMELGKTSKEVIKTTTAWTKTGQNLENATELGKTTLLGSNVGDVDVDTMQKYLIAPLKAWNVEAKDSIKIVDVLNAVSNKHAITVQDLGEAYTKSSSVMAMANNSLEETTALITASQAKTQLGGDVIGTALKTMSLRIVSTKSEDGNIIPKFKEDLDGIGVKVKDANGKLLSTYNIIKQLSQVWGNIGSDKQLNILEKLAGQRQANVLASMITNFNEAEKTLNDAMNSKGSAMEEQAKYAESLEFRINNIKEQLIGAYQKAINSNDLKFFLSLGSDALSVIEKIIEKVGVLGIVIGGISLKSKGIRESIFGSFNEKTSQFEGTNIIGKQINPISNQMIQSLKDYQQNTIAVKERTIELKNAIETFGGHSSMTSAKILGLNLKLQGLKVTQIAVKYTTIALQQALMLGIGLAINFAIQKVVELIQSYQKLKEANKEVIDGFNQNTKINADMISYLQTEGKEYDVLNSKTAKTVEEQRKLEDIKQRIGKIFPELITGYNKETGEIELQAKSTKELVKMLKEKQSIENSKLLANGDNGLKEVQKEASKTIDKIKEIKGKMESLQSGYNVNNDSYNSQNIDELTKKLQTLQQQKNEAMKSGNERETINLNKQITDTQNDLTKATQKYTLVNNELKLAMTEQQNNMEKLKPYISAVIDEYGQLDDKLKGVVQNVVQTKLSPEDLLKIDKGDFTTLTTQITNSMEQISKDVNVINLNNLIKVEKPDDSQIEKYFKSIFEVVEKYDIKPIELTKIFPLKVDPSQMNKVIDQYINQLESKLNNAKTETDKLNIQQNIDQLKSYKVEIKVNGADELEKAKTEAQALKVELEELQKAFNNNASELEFYNKAMNEINETNGLSANTVKEIATKYSDLAPYLNDTQMLYQKLKEKIGETEVQTQSSYEQMLWSDSNFANEVYKNTQWLSDMKAKWYDSDFSNWQNLAKGKAEVEAKVIQQVAGMWADYYDKQGNLLQNKFVEENMPDGKMYDNPRFREQLKEAQGVSNTIKNQFKELAKDLRQVTPSFDFKKISANKPSSGGSRKGSGSGSSAEKSDLTLAGNKKSIYDAMLKDIENGLDRQNNKINILNTNIGNLETLNKRSDAMKEQNKLVDEEIRKRNQLDKAVKDTSGITNKIAKQIKDNFKINIGSMSEKQITDYYNSNFGQDRSFGKSDNKNAKASKESYEKRKKLFEELINDYTKLSDAQDKYTKQHTESLAKVYAEENKYFDMYSQSLDKERQFYTDDTARYQHERDMQNISLTEDEPKNYDEIIKSQGGLAGGYVNEQQYLSNTLDGLKKIQSTMVEGSVGWNKINDEIIKHNGLLKESEKNTKSQISALNEVIKKKYEYLQTERDKAFKPINDTTDNLDELNKQNELTTESRHYLVNKSYLQQVSKMNEQENYNLLIQQKNELINQMGELKKGSFEWNILNEQVATYNEKIEDSNYKLKEMSKNILETKLRQQYKETEKYVFSGSTEKDISKQLSKDREALNQRKKIQEEYLSGIEKDYSLDVLKKDIYETNDRTLISTYETMKQSYSINKDEYETLKKKLNIRQLEMKLQNLQMEKTNKVMKQMSDGSFDFEFTVNQDEVDKTQEELKNAQLDLIKWKKDLNFKQEEELLSQREKAFETQKQYLADLKQIHDNALNGQYATQVEFTEAMNGLNGKLGTEYVGTWAYILRNQLNTNSELKTTFTDMENSYGTFVTSLKDLSTDLTNHVTEQSAIMQNTIGSMLVAFQQMLQIQESVNGITSGASSMSIINNVVTTSTPTRNMDRFDTGGYTGMWGSDAPKMGLLDRNELVLNSKDTNKMFDIDKLLSTIKGFDLLTKTFSNLNLSNLSNKLVLNNTNDKPTQNVYNVDKVVLPNIDSTSGAEDFFGNLKQQVSHFISK